MVLSLFEASQRERAAVAAFAMLPAELTKDLRKAGRDLVVPMAVDAATRHATTSVMRRIASTGRYSPGRDGTPGVAFGGTRPATDSGVPGRVLVRGLEFGSKGSTWRTFTTTSRKGTRYKVRRRVSRQFVPVVEEGRTIYPAMESITDDVVSLWVDLVEDAAVSALNGEG